jgi:flagellar protein FliL
MATNRIDESKGAAANQAAPAQPAQPAATGGGIKAWLPLIITVVSMPLVAFGTTKFLILPKLQHAAAGSVASTSETPAATSESKKTEETKSEGHGGGSKGKTTVPITKILVNLSGTMGTRYLMTSITLVGNTPDFKGKIEDNKDQLLDLATSTLSSKTISDLEKPGARNVIRSELISVFNNALGGPVVQEIYITEMAIQ